MRATRSVTLPRKLSRHGLQQEADIVIVQSTQLQLLLWNNGAKRMVGIDVFRTK